MNKVTPYLPIGLIALAVVAGFYFLYYKPKKQAATADALAAQNTANTALLGYCTDCVDLSSGTTKAKSKAKTSINPSILASLQNP